MHGTQRSSRMALPAVMILAFCAQHVQSTPPANGDRLPSEVENVGVYTLYKFDAKAKAFISQPSPSGLCIRTPFGPGKVNWKGMASPGATQLFSYKPEKTVPLKWATAPSNDVDGVYKRSWGTCKALKIPDSCTVDMKADGSYGSCCNLAASKLGHVVKLVNPCTDGSGWPTKPL